MEGGRRVRLTMFAVALPVGDGQTAGYPRYWLGMDRIGSTRPVAGLPRSLDTEWKGPCCSCWPDPSSSSWSRGRARRAARNKHSATHRDPSPQGLSHSLSPISRGHFFLPVRRIQQAGEGSRVARFDSCWVEAKVAPGLGRCTGFIRYPSVDWNPMGRDSTEPSGPAAARRGRTREAFLGAGRWTCVPDQ